MGSFFPLRRSSVKFLEEVWRNHGDVSSFDLGPYNIWLMVHPADVRQMFVGSGGNWEKNRLYRNLEPVVGRGLVASNGERWVKHRKLLQPCFHRRILGKVVAKTAQNAERTATWMAERGTVDLGSAMARLALRNIGDVLFDGAFEDRRVEQGLPFALRSTHERMYRLWKLPLWVPTPWNRRYRRAIGGLHDFVDGVIRARVGSTPKEDVVGLLFAAVADGRISVAEARDEVTTLIMAGHETTGLTLTWFFAAMSRNPAVYQNVLDEVRGLEESPADLGVGAAARLPYLKNVIFEVLRLFPPTWWAGRTPVVAEEVGGYTAEPGQIVSHCHWLTHRHPDFWEEPESFRPGRFDAGVPQDGSYIPFSMGRRRCAGREFAMLEMVVALATLLRRVDVLLQGHSLEPVGGIQLRPAAPVLGTVKLHR